MNEQIDMSRLILSVPYEMQDRWKEAARENNMELGQFIGWACDTVIRLQLVPLRGALMCRADKHTR